MPWTNYGWQNSPSTATPLSAVNLEDFGEHVYSLAVAQVFNVKDYGATGDGTTNDTTAVQAAIDAAEVAGGTVFFPRGTYSCSDLEVAADSVTLRGEGWGSIIKQRTGTAPLYLIKVNPGTGGTADPATNRRNLVFRDLQLRGTVDVDGFATGQNVHLMSLSAVDDVLIQNVYFRGYRADGLYLASSHSAGVERHNRYIKIVGCRFDGINQDNRNAITIIDGRDVLIQGCTFLNSTRTDMPGTIDIEPNSGSTFAVIRNIRIVGNYFEKCRGTAGAVAYHIIPTQADLTTKTQGVVVAHNVFNSVRCAAFFSHVQDPTDSTVHNDIIFANNYCNGGRDDASYLGNNPFQIQGVRGVKIVGNVFDYWWNGVSIGFAASQSARDVEIDDNVFTDVGHGDTRVIKLEKGHRIWFRRNTFDTANVVLRFAEGSGATGSSSGILFADNRFVGTVTTFANKAAGHTTTASSNRAYRNLLGSTTVDTTLFTPDVIVATATYDPPSLADGASASTTLTATGAAVGDFVEVNHSSVETNGGSWILHGFVSAADTVRVTIMNRTGGTVDLGSGTLRARVVRNVSP